jgi:hypothetical protein
MWRYRGLTYLAVGVGIGLWGQTLLAQAESATTRRSSKTASASTRKSAYEGEIGPVMEKLDDVLARLEDMDKRFDAVMEELRVVKVRSLMGGSGSGG